MNSVYTPDIKELVRAAHYRPAISILLPFNARINLKDELQQRLKFVSGQVRDQLNQNYPSSIVTPVLSRLKKIIDEINLDSFKKSLAIYLSPIYEKVIYLDVPVKEKIIVDESFEIRDLVYAAKEQQHFSVLMIGGKHNKVYLGNSSDLVQIHSIIPENIEKFRRDHAEVISNFTNNSDIREILLKKFLHFTDEGLTKFLQVYSFPVFILGTRKTIGYFRELTRNQAAIAGYITGNYEDQTESQLSGLLDPFIKTWKEDKLRKIYAHLERAAGSGRLVKGIQDVWQQASNGKGRLLVVEKDYSYSAELGREKDIITGADESKFSVIRDAVDDVIEKVLEKGGDVEFVEDGSLNPYDHIALVNYYR